MNSDDFFQPVFSNSKNPTKLLSDSTPHYPITKKLKNMMATHVHNHSVTYKDTKSYQNVKSC